MAGSPQLKKPAYAVGEELEAYLSAHARLARLPVHYDDLLRYESLLPGTDAKGKPSLWSPVMYRAGEIGELHTRLVELYQSIVADGSRIEHLSVAAIDLCLYGNSRPFRIKIINQINDNHDYYYVKPADASRIYGLELEHLLSPNRINFLCGSDTLVEEHIIGVPGDELIQRPEDYGGHLNPVRMSKEFIKFNERCFVRLLGDMRAYNFVVNVIHDVDQVQYRLRAIDFDQQCYEGRARFYLPQFFKENLPFVHFAQRHISLESSEQYRNEERALLRRRYQLGAQQMDALLKVMANDVLSTPKHIAELRAGLRKYHGCGDFTACNSMGAVLREQLQVALAL